MQIHPDDRAVIDQFEVGTAPHALETCAWGMLALGYGIVDTEPGEWMTFIAPNGRTVYVEVAERDLEDTAFRTVANQRLNPADHPDADRPPGTSGSWGEV